MKDIHVRSGELAFCDQPPAFLNTVVGVCVTVCIWDRVEKRGGLCHYRLAIKSEAIEEGTINGFAKDSGELSGHGHDYGSEAIVALLKKFKMSGSVVGNLEARILGGADIHNGHFTQGQRIGEKNIGVALTLLGEFGIPIVGKAVGGAHGRQIRFNTGSGEVCFRLVIGDDFSGLVQEEAVPRSLLQEGINAYGQKSVTMPEQVTGDRSKIRILVIDKSAEMRARLKSKIEEGRKFVVVAQVSNVTAAQSAIETYKPDVITIDFNSKSTEWMGFIGGYMKQNIIPTVIVSSLNQETPDAIFNALKLGVFDYLDISSLGEIHTVLNAAYKERQHMESMRVTSVAPVVDKVCLDKYACLSSLIVVGSSTGGVEALETILKQLPKTTPPICIVQHIPKDFSRSLASRLNDICEVEVSEAEDGLEVKDSHVYIADGGRHMKLIQLAPGKLILRLSDGDLINGFRPSIDHLFNSVQKISGKKVVGVLLTGMGQDGAQGLLNLKKHGAFTIAQDEATSVVYGMAKVANELGGVCRTTALNRIPSAIFEALVKPREKQRVTTEGPQNERFELKVSSK